jgi:glycosyltransferase involved in cell wall biosynthesis
MHLHGNPKKERSSSRRARFAFCFFNALLPRMHKIVAVSPGLARYIEEHVGHHVRVEYLPNPVRQFSGVTRPARPDGAVAFVTVGRLSWEKGHDILVEAFAKVLSGGLDAHLTIVGDGAAHTELVALVQRLGVGDRVRLTGKIPNPAWELEQADCFVSASRWEGFGVAIVEALSAGLYVIASDCEFGPRGACGCHVGVRSVRTNARPCCGAPRSRRPLQHRPCHREARGDAGIGGRSRSLMRHAPLTR